MAKKKRKKKAKKRTIKRTCPARKASPNPVSLARTLISKVAEPGSNFTLSALKAGLRSAGYRNVKGWFDQMIADAMRRRLITPVTSSIYTFTPAAAGARRNPRRRSTTTTRRVAKAKRRKK